MEDGDFNSFFDCIMNDSEGTASCETTSKPADLQETTPVQNDLDDFFDCINEQSTEETDLKPAPIYESKADDSVELDEFFDCINSPHNEEAHRMSRKIRGKCQKSQRNKEILKLSKIIRKEKLMLISLKLNWLLFKVAASFAVTCG